jgi:O-antigen/teichoic acid export membrane protein
VKIDPAIIYLVLAYIPLHFIAMNYQYLIIYFENTRAYNVLVVTQGIVGSLISIVLLVVFNLGILAMAIGMVSGGILAMFYGYRQISKIEKMKFRFNRGLLIDMVKYSYNLYISGLIGHFNAYLSGLIVAILMSPAYVSFYQLGKARAELLNRIPSAIGTILYPVVSKSGKSGINTSELTAMSFRVSLILLMFFGVIGSLLIYPFTILLYGREFVPLTTAFWILIPSVIVFGSSSLLSSYFLGIGRPDINLKISVVPVIPQVIFCYLLIPLFGVAGAAVSTALTFILLSIIRLIVFKKIAGLTYHFLLIPNHADIEIVYNFIKRKMNTIIKTVNPNWRFFKIGVEKVNSFAKDRMKP